VLAYSLIKRRIRGTHHNRICSLVLLPVVNSTPFVVSNSLHLDLRTVFLFLYCISIVDTFRTISYTRFLKAVSGFTIENGPDLEFKCYIMNINIFLKVESIFWIFFF
jgi:uncharacterized membrane protein